MQITGTKCIEGKMFTNNNANGIIARFKKKFQCFPYSLAPILKFAETTDLIIPKIKSGPDVFNNLLK